MAAWCQKDEKEGQKKLEQENKKLKAKIILVAGCDIQLKLCLKNVTLEIELKLQ